MRNRITIFIGGMEPIIAALRLKGGGAISDFTRAAIMEKWEREREEIMEEIKPRLNEMKDMLDNQG